MSSSEVTPQPVPFHQPCRFCGGKGMVYGVVDDVEFVFDCICSSGDEAPIRWLLGSTWLGPSDTEWGI